MIDALGWGESEAEAIVDRWDPRRFHVADRLLQAPRKPRPAAPLPLRRPTPVAIAVSRLLLLWSQTEYRPWVEGRTRAFGSDLGLHPDDEILLVASVDATSPHCAAASLRRGARARNGGHRPSADPPLTWMICPVT